MFDIITIGTATRDGFFEGINFVKTKCSYFATGEGICLPFGSKIEVPKITFTTGGVGTNSAVAFQRQGLKTAVICRVGSDVSGGEIIRGLAKEKINTQFIQKDFDTPTAYSVIFLTKSGERTILSYKGTGEELTEKEIPWQKLKTKWFFIGSLGGNKELLLKLFSFAQKNKINIAGNPGSREIKILKQEPELLNYYDIFILNQEEASYLTDIPFQREEDIFRKLDKWIGGIAVMTKAAAGVTVSNGCMIWQVGIFKEKKLIDRTGAGDAFGSGFTAGLLQRFKNYKKTLIHSSQKQYLNELQTAIEYALRLGSANATSVVEYIGAKEGIIAKKDFERDKRWRHLRMTRIEIK